MEIKNMPGNSENLDINQYIIEKIILLLKANHEN